MRPSVIAGLFALLLPPLLPTPAARAAETAPAAVTACDSLVTLRRIMAQDAMPPDPDRDPDEPAPVVDRTGCHEVAANTIGDTQRRAMIGGAPYECRSIAGGPCLWVRP